MMMMMMMVVVMMVMVVSFIMTIRMEEKNAVVMIMIIIMIMMHFPITIPPTMRGVKHSMTHHCTDTLQFKRIQHVLNSSMNKSHLKTKSTDCDQSVEISVPM